MLLCPTGVISGSGTQGWGFQGSMEFSGHRSGTPRDMNDIEGSEKGTELGKGLEHKSKEGKLRELAGLSLEEKRLRRAPSGSKSHLAALNLPLKSQAIANHISLLLEDSLLFLVVQFIKWVCKPIPKVTSMMQANWSASFSPGNSG